MTQSAGISNRLTQMIEDGRCLNDDSSLSEKVLTEAMSEIIPFATKIFQQIGYKIVLEKSISLFECQTFFEKVGGPKPNPANNKVCMRPDGGILYAVSGGVKYQFLLLRIKSKVPTIFYIPRIKRDRQLETQLKEALKT
jgi:hypothetical protein